MFVAVQRRDAAAVDPARFASAAAAPLPSIGSAEAVEHAAEQLVGAPDARGGGDVLDPVAARDAGRCCESGISSVRSLRKPITSAVDVLPPKLWIRHSAAERQRQVGGLDRQPADALHLPDDARTASLAATASSWAASEAQMPLASLLHSGVAASGSSSCGDAVELARRDRRRRCRCAREDAAAAGRDSVGVVDRCRRA